MTRRDSAGRERALLERLRAAARGAGGELAHNDRFVEVNASLDQDPCIVTGSFGVEFLDLPECVIFAVMRSHPRSFAIHSTGGALLPAYLSITDRERDPEVFRQETDRAIGARLTEALAFFRDDLATPLAERRSDLARIVVHPGLGTMLAKAERIERLARELGLLLMLPEPTLMAAASGAHLAKCDLTTRMVTAFPELAGEMGTAYALAQGVSADAAGVVRAHYAPRGPDDATAPTDAGALVAIADRLDTLVGSFAIGLFPTGATETSALGHARADVLRTMRDHDFVIRLDDAIRAAYDGYTLTQGFLLGMGENVLVGALSRYFGET